MFRLGAASKLAGGRLALPAQHVDALEDLFEAIHDRSGVSGMTIAARSRGGVIVVVTVDEAFGIDPRGLDDAEEPLFHFGGRLVAIADHIVDLGDAVAGDAPGTGDDPKSFERKVGRGLIRPVVVPVADHDIFGNEVDGAEGVVVACFPLADAGGLAVDEPVAPDPKLTAFRRQVVMKGLHFTRKQHRGVAAATAGTFAFPEIEHLVHAGVKGGGFEGVADFVDHGEEDIVYAGIQRAVAAAIQVVVIGPDIVHGVLDPGGLVELRIDLEQLAGVFFPALVAEHIDLGDDPDLLLRAGANDLFDVRQRKREAIRELGMRFELIVVVDEDKKGIDLPRAEGIMNEVNERVDAGRPGGADTEAANGH